MPFKTPYRPYTEGDFIFGIGESITSFQKSLPTIDFKATPSTAGTTVRQLSVSRTDVATKFTGERQDMNNAYLDVLEKHPKYINAPTLTYGSDTAKTNAEFRMKSKMGLQFCIVSGRYLHFILDGLGLHEVLAKSWKHPTKPANPNNEFKTSPTDKIRTVTGAELRWIYRNSGRPDTQSYVQFWFKNTACCPPWDPGFVSVLATAPLPSAWASYKAI